jgi:MFS family permease
MRTCFGKVVLNEGVETRNYVGCLLHYFMLSFVFVSVDSLQPLLFQKQYQIERKEQIENFRNALVITLDIAVKLVCAPVFGYLADRLGRKTVNLYGILCVAAALFAMPYVGSYELYVLLRCFYATGTPPPTQAPSPSPSCPSSPTTSTTKAGAHARPSWCSCPPWEPSPPPKSTSRSSTT